MLTRPTHRPAQTIQQAKAEYKKFGPRISTQDVRQLERGAILFRRAETIKNNEKKRKAAVKRKHEKETRERETRRRMHIASQKAYVSPHQCLMSNFLDTANPGTGDGSPNNRQEHQRNERNEIDPWEGDCLDDRSLLDAIESVKISTSGFLDPAAVEEHEISLKYKTIGAVPQWQPQEVQRISVPRRSETPALPAPHNKSIIVHKFGSKSTSIRSKAAPKDQGLQDGWDDFFVSSTQIEREITCTTDGCFEKITPSPVLHVEFFSTQDVTFSVDELEELDRPLKAQYQRITPSTIIKSGLAPSKDHDRFLMPPPRLPRNGNSYSTCRKEIFDCDDLLLSDFTLSTQDCREIMG